MFLFTQSMQQAQKIETKLPVVLLSAKKQWYNIPALWDYLSQPTPNKNKMMPNFDRLYDLNLWRKWNEGSEYNVKYILGGTFASLLQPTTVNMNSNNCEFQDICKKKLVQRWKIKWVWQEIHEIR